MNNFISIVEIPASSFARAVKFYQTVLDITIQEADMEGIQMGLFPGGKGSVNVVLIKGNDYKPSGTGILVYLNGGDDLQNILDKIEPAGGKVVLPKTPIDTENGFFAFFIDSEGNKMGLHSYQ